MGHIFVQAAFKAFDLHPPYAVEEQKDPDPEFPTVKYPNPEEGEGVLVKYTRTHPFGKVTFFVLNMQCQMDSNLYVFVNVDAVLRACR